MTDRPPASGEPSTEHMREVSAHLRKMADQYADRFHPNISYLLAGANYVGVLADRYAAAPPEGLDADLMREIVQNGVPPDALMDSSPAGQNLRNWWLDQWAPVLQKVRARLSQQKEQDRERSDRGE